MHAPHIPVTVLVLAALVGAPLCCMDAAGADPEGKTESAKRAWTNEVRRALGFEDAALWRGGTAVPEPKRTGNAAMRWEKHTTNTSLECLQTPSDLSAFNVMSFWLHSSHADSATFMIIVESQREEGVFSYFMKKVAVDWTGWKQLEFHFRSFGKARSPVGWGKVDKIRFTASGWNQSPSDEPVWVLDDLDFRFSDKPYRPVINVRKYVREPAREEFLAKLRRGHPRLILLDEELPRVKDFVGSDPRGTVWYDAARRRAEDLYRRPVRKHELPDGRRLLSISRDVCDRLYHWGFLYRMEGDRKWLDRAWREMEAVVAFKDWNPSHYLDTAEMMHAVGIGYDWFYNDLSESQRRTIREGLWQHGLRLSHAAYMGLEGEGSQGWKGVSNNWNFVCNGGTSLGAMAVLDEMPEACSEILHQAYQYIQVPIHHFEPDGAWWEGVGYWGYSMRYFLAYLRGLETSFGTDFGFVESLKGTGFALAGDFPVYLVSPLGGTYNFADSGSGGSSYRHWGFFFLADKFRNPLYQHFQEQRTRGSVADILYYRPFESDLAIQDVKLDKYFRKTEVATMRSSWTDRDALFVGVKCGKNGIAHAHQDLGSFVFYGLGEKWLVDLGTERQTYLAHQHHLPKWHFYRIREEGHNTLVFNPDEKFCQDPKGESTILRFESSPKDVFAVADLTHAYRKHATSVRRGYRLFDHRRAFLVQDEIRGKAEAELWWFAHGSAGVTCSLSKSGRSAVLERNGKTCHAYLLAPPDATFAVMDATPLPTSRDPEIQNPNRDVKKLAVHLHGTKDVTIAALFVPTDPFGPQPTATADIVPLDSWRIAGVKDLTLSRIVVGGAPLPGFSPTVFSYTVRLAPDTTMPPAVAAQAADATNEVEVEAPEAFPGAARISVTDRRSGAASVYLVRFLPEMAAAATEKPQKKSKTVTVRGVTVSASRDDGNGPGNVLDGDLETRWSASGTEEWIAFDFGEPRSVGKLDIAWYSGDKRQTRFKVSVSSDGRTWRDVFEGESSGKSAKLETYQLKKPETARHLRITCYGNTSNLWNSITEVGF